MACKKILIIDDDKELCEELVEFLQAEGYAAECASDSIDGEKLVRSKKYDMVLLDYKMPVLTGVDLLKRLKADNIRERIFIISGRPS
ncbi:MAG: response regulator, partial [Candidatus Omnitrophica bacterium]|nr:response regulator [Candidatus Omnitrophota bacterium]